MVARQGTVAVTLELLPVPFNAVPIHLRFLRLLGTEEETFESRVGSHITDKKVLPRAAEQVWAAKSRRRCQLLGRSVEPARQIFLRRTRLRSLAILAVWVGRRRLSCVSARMFTIVRLRWRFFMVGAADGLHFRVSTLGWDSNFLGHSRYSQD